MPGKQKEAIMPARFLIGAVASGSGKTTLTLGLMALLSRRGLTVQGFKVGPDYIDPAFQQLVTGRPAYNLDVWMGGEADVRDTFARHTADVDVAIIEGVMGLLDGAASDSNWGSSAHIAALLDCPVVLVLDISAMARSAAAIVKGLALLARGAKIRGVVLNRAGSPGHAEMVQRAIEQETGISVLGYLTRDDAITLPERHLGLVTASETGPAARAKLEAVGQHLAATLDVDRLLEIAGGDGAMPAQKEPPAPPPTRTRSGGPRVAIARDQAFNFYYPANLDLLNHMGATLLWFQPTNGEPVPAGATHLYLGGGFPEEYLEQLTHHRAVLTDMAKRIAVDRLPTLAECGGFMFLGDAIWSGQERYAMVGLIPMETEMTPRLQALGYRSLTVRQDGVFPAGSMFRGHAYHHSRVRRHTIAQAAYDVASVRGPLGSEGYAANNVLAGYSHLYFPSSPEAVEQWLHNGQ